jgi:hypothetical protein
VREVVPVATMNRTCEACGDSFYQYRGRPAKRCPECRGGDRYGAAHQAYRAATVDQAVGKPCVRCQQVMLEGQAVQLDHADDGSGRYLGYSHQRCNASAGAAHGNRMRAAAYRAAKGLPASNSSGAVVVREPPPAPRVCQRSREEITAEAQTTGQGLPCICGAIASRCW